MNQAWRLAVGTLTAFPVRPPERVDPRVAGLAIVLGSLAALPIAVLAGAVGWLGGVAAELPGLLVAGLVLGVVVLSTRAMHLDGLADTADGLSAGFDRAKALDVMRRGNIGPSGVAAVCLVVVVDAGAMSVLVTSWEGVTVLGLCVVVSRSTLALACARGVPAARRDGLGGAVAGSVAPAALAASGLLVLAGSVAVCVAVDLPWWAGAVVWLAAWAVALLVVRRSVTRFGGITGDVLGAVVELGLAASLVAASLVVP